MGQIVYRANLAAPSFPFLSENFGKTVIVKGQDQNSVPNLISNCGGLTDVEMAVTDVNASGQYVYTTSGMQLVTVQRRQRWARRHGPN